MESTLIILKPDCMQNGLCGRVISLFEKEGFTIKQSCVRLLDKDLLKDHYSHIIDLPFFPEIQAFMSSAPVLIFILEGQNVIIRVRDLLGATDPKLAEKGTIRAELGTDRMKNVVHASDSKENALIEIKRFFPNI